MEYGKFGNVTVVRLDRGDEICECVKNAARLSGIKLAFVSGIGATDKFAVGVFDETKKAYDEISCAEPCEIVSLTGNVTTMDGEVYTHLHMTCAGAGGKVVGGHLLKARVSLTAEIFIEELAGEVDRKRDGTEGINKIKFIK